MSVSKLRKFAPSVALGTALMGNGEVWNVISQEVVSSVPWGTGWTLRTMRFRIKDRRVGRTSRSAEVIIDRLYKKNDKGVSEVVHLSTRLFLVGSRRPAIWRMGFHGPVQSAFET